MLKTGRQRILMLEELSLPQIQQLPQLQDLFLKIKSVDDKEGSLLKLVWDVFGGIPLDYIALQDKVVLSLHSYVYSNLIVS